MLVDRIWSGNRLRNYHYLVACPETGEALAVDPLQWQDVLASAKGHGWTITQILNTHEHGDHTGGNAGLVGATGAKVLAHARAASSIGGVDRGLNQGDVIRVGRTVELQCLDTPGHTMTHICAFASGDEPALFSGDTLFNAGAGNCHNGGHPEALYDTFASQITRLPGATRLYAGHDYLVNNLDFTMDREPGNASAATMLARLRATDAADMPVLTLGEEQAYNTFFRLDNPLIIARLRECFPDLSEHPDPKQVFLRLRELRNKW
ncbi:MAG: hydroxyacylglutathione hydrolase [Steroidobacteraceae bacterium]